MVAYEVGAIVSKSEVRSDLRGCLEAVLSLISNLRSDLSSGCLEAVVASEAVKKGPNHMSNMHMYDFKSDL